jgi:DNA topoisomerase IB
VVDTKTEVALERQGAVIPPAIQPAFLAMQAEGVAQAPGEQACESRTLVRVEQNLPISPGRVIDVACFRGDIEIAA